MPSKASKRASRNIIGSVKKVKRTEKRNQNKVNPKDLGNAMPYFFVLVAFIRVLLFRNFQKRGERNEKKSARHSKNGAIKLSELSGYSSTSSM